MIAALVASHAAHADGPPSAEDQALATTLFRDGKALLAAGNVAEACPKLEESQRLDPGGGTLLNLAVCHEKEGKTATAWAEFRQARIVAERDRRDDRIELADTHIAALEPKLSKLTIAVGEGVDGPAVEILLDGRSVRRPAWGTATPVDPGDHAIEAHAPGKKTWHTRVHLNEAGDAVAVPIPPWEDEAPAQPATAPETVGPVSAAPPPARDRTAAVVAGGIGATSIVIAAIFGARAIVKHDESPCTTNPCSGASVAANDAAKTAADVSSVAFAVGVAALGVGAYLWLTAGPTTATGRAVRVTPFGLFGAF